MVVSELYVTGTGQQIEVHERKQDCLDYGCCIHNPSKCAKKIGVTHWREDRMLMERICEHGVGHPDPDGIAFRKRWWGYDYDPSGEVHGCDGCCHITSLRREHMSEHLFGNQIRWAISVIKWSWKQWQKRD